ncbi:MAG: FtsX-like permease family protein [Luteitalea sp.]|nr:FtsX-like permease family protein [Luteitalea sp.]
MPTGSFVVARGDDLSGPEAGAALAQAESGLYHGGDPPFTMRDDDPSARRVAVLTDSLWRSAFGRSPDVLGEEIRVAGSVFSIIGVAEPGFTGFTPGSPAEVIVPLAQRPWRGGIAPDGPDPFHFWVVVLGRLAPSVSREQAQATLSAMERRLFAEGAPARYTASQQREYVNRRLVVRSAARGLETGGNARLERRFEGPLYGSWGICTAMLLVGCVNLAILFLGRGLARQREIATRLALGASRVALVRLLTLETAPLVLVGAALGTLLAGGMNRLVAVQAESMLGIVLSPATPSLWLDLRTLLFLTVLIAIVATALAIVPVWQAGRLADAGGLKGSGRGIVGTTTRTQKILLGVQVAVALALVSGSGLLTASLSRLLAVDLGMRMRGVSVVTLAGIPGVTPTATRVPYYRDLVDQLEALPDVASASVVDFAPLSITGLEKPVASVESLAISADVRAEILTVTDKLFETLGVPLVAGEGFRRSDQGTGESSGETPTIVSQSLGKRFGGERLIGRHIRVGEARLEKRLRVVGIAADAQLHHPLRREPHMVYIDLWRDPDIWSPFLLVKTRSGAPLPSAEVRRVVAARGQHYVENYRTLDQNKDRATTENRWLANVSTGVAALSLILAATGLFGLLSYHVASRTSEIGIRMALGARRRQIQWHVLRQLLPVMLAGTFGGIGLTLVLGRLIAGLLYGVSGHDPRLLALSIAVLIATAALAALIPARKAASVDPVVALRHE